MCSLLVFLNLGIVKENDWSLPRKAQLLDLNHSSLSRNETVTSPPHRGSLLRLALSTLAQQLDTVPSILRFPLYLASCLTKSRRSLHLPVLVIVARSVARVWSVASLSEYNGHVRGPF